SNWWDGYKRHEIVLFDKWYTSLDWNDIVKYLNDTPENVEQKGKTFVPFLAKYVFMTSHKPPEEAFNFRRYNINEEISTQRDWGQFYRLEEEFRSMTWDVKYRKGEFTSEELKAVVQELNKNQDGEVIIKADNQVYWCRCFSKFKKNYLCDYPRCPKRKPNKRLKHRIEKFINDSNHEIETINDNST
ncbi:3316_t:CDS:2, partial [Dentiscutata heterogama]